MMKEDRGSFKMKPGTQKRLSGNCRQVQEALQWETRVYEAHVRKGRTMRRFKNDVVEVFAGMANITAEALSRQLRAIQPIDAVHGIRLDVKEDFKKLTQLLVDRRPFLVVWEIRCDPWSNIQHLNYTAEELANIRESQYESIKGMCDSISFLKAHYGVHFLLGNPCRHTLLETPRDFQADESGECEAGQRLHVQLWFGWSQWAFSQEGHWMAVRSFRGAQLLCG